MVESYKAVRLSVPGDLSTLSIESIPVPRLSEGEVLVHMEYSAMNPSDIGTVFGKYPSGPPPLTPGIEGSGTVVLSGGSDLSNSLLNRRVSVSTRGTWAEYAVASASSVFPLLDSTTFEQAANLIVNPMTVAQFVEKIQKGGHRAAVQNAAASALGKMLNKWCKILGIPLVNLVRRQEQVDILRAIGAEHVFNTAEEGWKQRAKELCTGLGASIAFDAIAGEATGEIADLIGDGGVVYNYGALSGKSCSVGSMHLILQRKRFEGIWLTPWLFGKSYEDRMEVGNLVQGLIREVFETEHARVINLGQIHETLTNYNEASATNNKILIRNRVE